MNTWQAEAWKCCSVLPGKILETSRRPCLIKGGGKCHSPMGLVWSPHLASPSASHLCPPSTWSFLAVRTEEVRRSWGLGRTLPVGEAPRQEGICGHRVYLTSPAPDWAANDSGTVGVCRHSKLGGVTKDWPAQTGLCVRCVRDGTFTSSGDQAARRSPW
ncbi:hypothetical protein HJG60_008765 [Phyllostomus discolor]|uniref:Uncharacterized protein n=1 Tax=Phyllostomus discolor TaxID=89673 RepID=A0A834DIX0_9CHIR|nr:hypothetical protein HJG60_008765 [Phyllostomus discolor]